MALELTLSERFAWVKDTLREGGSLSLELSDEHLADMLFSDFDTDTWSALHTNTLDVLLEAGLISVSVRECCIMIGALAQVPIGTAHPPVTGQFIRDSTEWRDLMRSCDEALCEGEGIP